MMSALLSVSQNIVLNKDNNNLRIYKTFLIRMHYGRDLLGQIYELTAVDESQQEISDLYFQIKRPR